MLCSSIKLTDRKEAQRDCSPAQGNESSTESMTSHDCHSYSFRWDKPKLFYNCDPAHFLTVNNIMLPENARAFNTGSSIEKWSKKHPRLKSTKSRPRPGSSSDVSEDNFDVTPLLAEISKETEDPFLETNGSESDLDPDVRNLLSVAEEDWKHQRKKHRHKRKDKSEEKSGKKKSIKFSLSKPPSPQTVQVIRVEVTSNFSMEEPEEISDCSKGCGLRIRSDLKKALELEELEEKDEGEIMIHCNKLVLCSRASNEK